jgi:hypothetical protein
MRRLAYLVIIQMRRHHDLYQVGRLGTGGRDPGVSLSRH